MTREPSPCHDAETKLYYLQSRYYNPEMGRFINADAFASTGQGFTGNNMFAYCGNNPVCNIDPAGTCYYGANGQWCHDNWEYIGGYERQPDPGYYQGTTPSGVSVYSVPNAYYVLPPKSVGFIDKRDTNLSADGRPDPDIQILNSYRFTNLVKQYEILVIIYAYIAANPSQNKWDRTRISSIIEWIAHNDIYRVKPNYSCQHVDLNNNHQYVGYLGFWHIAITSQLHEWGVM